MKLYEFTVTDNLNLSETEILKGAELEAADQANLEGWVEGYTYQQTKVPDFLPTGEKVYHFAVYGELLDIPGDDTSEKQKSGSPNFPDDMAAQPQAEI